MNCFTLKLLFFCVLLSLLPLSLYAQSDGRKSVALVPFWGRDLEIIDDFGEELYDGVYAMADFRPWEVDMINLPEDVPEGGFPPYICPSPSLTRGTPYALTGEIFPNEDEPDLWDVMLYLWEMEDAKLLRADKMTVYDREEYMEGLPGMLEWLFSWIPRDLGPYEGGLSRVIWSTPSEPTKWLYLGIRGGGGIMINSEPRNKNLGNRYYINNYYENFNLALYSMVSMPNIALLSNFGLQVEGMLNGHTKPFANPPSLSVFVSPLLRYTQRWASNYFSVLGGPYFVFPLYEVSYINDTYPWGWTIGIKCGTKFGPGSVFLDIRYLRDLMDTIDVSSDNVFRRNMVNVSVGYEFGIATRK
ncbi:MAG: hypothetical protein FWG89_04600 [Treponema sp.]|nr:hypothetical protein [Treponema sp.]